MRRWVMILTAALVAGLFIAATVAAAPSPTAVSRATTWYWSPAWCKSALHKYGMQLGDGRTFNIQQAYCIGTGGVQTCSWSSSHTTRQYRCFSVLARAYDGTVRAFTLTPTSRDAYRATNFRAYRKYALEPFIALALPYAAQAARVEQAKGCGAP
jgi:hypothetical protein